MSCARLTVLAVAALLAVGCSPVEPEGPAASTSSRPVAVDVAVGDCVTVKPDRERELHAEPMECGKDFGFIVAGRVGDDGDSNCPPSGSTFPVPFADRATAALCLVPSFTVGECYAFGIPSGMYDPVDCDPENIASLRIDQRLDTADGTCPENHAQRAMSFDSPPLTYCYTSLGIEP